MAQQAVYSVHDGNIIADSAYIMPFLHGQPNESGTYAVYTGQVSSGSGDSYEVALIQYGGWENEPGDYHAIRVSYGGQSLCDFRDDNGWDFFYIAKDYKKDKETPFRTVPLSQGRLALIFTGITIMSQPPLVTVVVLEGGKATLVYNYPSYINDVDTSGESLEYQLQLNTVEYNDDGIPSEEAALRTLTFKDGLVYYSGDIGNDKGCYPPVVE